MTAARGNVVIAFPTYNGARFLREALECALAQTYPYIQVLVVDDSSADDTVAVARSFQPRVEVHCYQESRGIGGNWNRCVELSAGADYLLIAHQDDRMGPRLVELAVDLLEREPGIGFVHASIEQIDETGKVICGHGVHDHEPEIAKKDFVRKGTLYYERLMDGPSPICCPTVVARRKLYDEVGLYDETYKFAVDIQMYFRMLRSGDVGYLVGPLYQVRRHAGQTTSRQTKSERYQDVIRAKLDGLAGAEESGRFDERALGRLRRSVARDCCEAARRYALGDPAYARRHLKRAAALNPRSALCEDFLVGTMRTIWTSLFGSTAAGRARFVRKGI